MRLLFWSIIVFFTLLDLTRGSRKLCTENMTYLECGELSYRILEKDYYCERHSFNDKGEIAKIHRCPKVGKCKPNQVLLRPELMRAYHHYPFPECCSRCVDANKTSLYYT
ncbi:uncharacterized protein LOC106645732 [Copidosoma floridanum]|uniref:uncharacterized protein LOC106645732 n=1 Tax=Copidosoma floridanum TaxID=29053 RepID=UPI0006C9B923|nr:uncharacterized protein LOC106645732 [Copidosoma floridanum]